MDIFFEKLLAQLLFWIYDFLDTISAIFNILTGTQAVNSDGRTLLEVFVESAVSTKVLISLCIIAVIIVGACMGVKIVKNIVQLKAGGEVTSHAVTVKQGGLAILSSVSCIFFVFMFIAFASMLLNMVNNALIDTDCPKSLSQNLFDLSVEQSYVLDDTPAYRETLYLDEYGEPVQKTDANSPDGLAWETDAAGNLIKDENGDPIPVYEMVKEEYYPYKTDENGNYIVENGWVNSHTSLDLKWSYTPDQVFGVHEMDWLKLFEKSDKKYTVEPMVRLDSFNFLTAYLVAIVMLISMFMMSIGLVKRIYDIMILLFCMPLVCGTIPLDDGARFRAWRETMMSKVLIVFGAVIGINVFFMFSAFITGPSFDLTYLIDNGVLSGNAVQIFKMLLLLGGAVCIYGSQTLIARVLGTSADESREAMQSFNLITSGVRMGAVGIVGAGRVAMGAKRIAVGGTNRYGRQRVGALPYMFRAGNSIGERVGGNNYAQSRGAAFVRRLGRMGGLPYGHAGGTGTDKNAGGGHKQSGGFAQPAAQTNPMHTSKPVGGSTTAPAQSGGVQRANGGYGANSQTAYRGGNSAPTQTGERQRANSGNSSNSPTAYKGGVSAPTQSGEHQRVNSGNSLNSPTAHKGGVSAPTQSGTQQRTNIGNGASSSTAHKGGVSAPTQSGTQQRTNIGNGASSSTAHKGGVSAPAQSGTQQRTNIGNGVSSSTAFKSGASAPAQRNAQQHSGGLAKSGEHGASYSSAKPGTGSSPAPSEKGIGNNGGSGAPVINNVNNVTPAAPAGKEKNFVRPTEGLRTNERQKSNAFKNTKKGNK